MSTPFFAGRGHARRAVDLAVLASLFVLALLGLGPAYGTAQYIVTGVVGLALATVLALIGARWSWGLLRMVPALLLIYLLLGSTFAAPTRAYFGALPSLGSLWDVIKAPVTTWMSMLTMAPPVGTGQAVLAVTWISMLVLAVIGQSIVLRSRRYLLAWMLPFAMLAVSILFGTTQESLALLRGVLFAVISLTWLTWRFESDRLAGARSTIISDTVRPGSWKNPVLRRRIIGGTLIVLLAVGGTVLARPLLDPPAGTQRFALRDTIEPPFDPDEYVSPLAQFRGYLKHQQNDTLLTIDGVEAGDRIRLATMDQYDGEVYNVAGGQDKGSDSGAFLRSASGVNLAEQTPANRTSRVTIGDYNRVWVPTVGRETTRIDVESDRSSLAETLYFNAKSQTMADSQGLRKGDTYTLSWEPYTEPTAAQTKSLEFGDVGLPSNLRMDPELGRLAKTWMGGSDADYEKVQNLIATLRGMAYFSHGIKESEAPSLSGHGAARLLSMLEDVGFDEDNPAAAPTGMIGDEEQFSALVAVMLRTQKVPARVVMGFEVPKGTQGSAEIVGKDVTAWVEVYFEGFGWARFDPTPDEDKTPKQPDETQVDKPRPQVAQPPPPPTDPPTPPPGAMSEDAPTDKTPDDDGLTLVQYLVGAVTLPVLLIALAMAAIALAKRRRRGRRRRAEGSALVLDGGWQEVLDLHTDLHRPLDPMATRAETARALAGEYPDADLELLGRRADLGVFGPGEIPPPMVEEFWSQAMDTRRTMAASVPWHRRFRAAVSLRSLRRQKAMRRHERRRLAAAEKRRRSRQAHGKRGAAARRRGRRRKG